MVIFKAKKNQIMHLDAFYSVAGLIPASAWETCDGDGVLDGDSGRGDHAIFLNNVKIRYEVTIT